MPVRPARASALIGGFFLGVFLGILVLLTGCRDPRPDQKQVARSEASATEWQWLQGAKKRLDAQRAQLQQLQMEAQKAPLPPNAPESPDRERLRQQVGAQAAELSRRLVDFINANAEDSPGAPPSDRQRAAIRMKSDEDILLAHEFMAAGGDYRRAIEIYETALAADPDNARLRQELETARVRRYMTRERFAQVREGMGEPEVRRLLGSPNLQDIRTYPERGVTAWFYPKDATGAAAAVWFDKKTGEAKVYLLDFDAIQPPGKAPRP